MLPEQPKELLIIGAGAIGMEFAYFFNAFGTKVTVVEMQDRLIAREDEDISAGVQEILEGEEVTVRLNAECIAFEKGPMGVRMNVNCAEDSTPLDGRRSTPNW